MGLFLMYSSTFRFLLSLKTTKIIVITVGVTRNGAKYGSRLKPFHRIRFCWVIEGPTRGGPGESSFIRVEKICNVLMSRNLVFTLFFTMSRLYQTVYVKPKKVPSQIKL
jgi:hypothetical protein